MIFIILFFVKAPDWKYEQEVRYVFYKEESTNKIQIRDGKYFLNVGKPKAIYIGSKCNEDNIKEINRIAKEANIKVYLGEMDEKCFGLQFH